MALTDKNIVITPNTGVTSDPQIVFSGADATTSAQNISLKTYPTSNGTLSFEGSAGQLFSITNSLTGTIFSVNDVSGIPSITVLDTGTISLAQYGGNVLLGTATDNGNKLQVNGNVSANVYTSTIATGTAPFSVASTTAVANLSIGGTAAGLSTTLAVASGGTNSTATPTAGGIGYGTGTAHAYTAVGTSGQVLTSAGTGVPTWTTPATSYTTTQTFTGSTSVLGVILNNAAETTNVVASALTGVVPIYLNLGAVQYYTAAATAAWTPNISLSSLPTTLNNSLAIGQSTTVTIMATQGTTAYFSNALQIDSTAVTMKWQGGSAPTAGNISGIDVYTYTITKTAASTYIVLASFTQFK